MLKDKTGNQINAIHPYRTSAGWSFDDEEVGLLGEPFVGGIPEIIDSIVGEDVNEFSVYISKETFPTHNGVLTKIKGTGENGWYQLEGTEMEGWLCPAMLKYLPGYVDKIFFEIKK